MLGASAQGEGLLTGAKRSLTDVQISLKSKKVREAWVSPQQRVLPQNASPPPMRHFQAGSTLLGGTASPQPHQTLVPPNPEHPTRTQPPSELAAPHSPSSVKFPPHQVFYFIIFNFIIACDANKYIDLGTTAPSPPVSHSDPTSSLQPQQKTPHSRFLS